MDAFRSQPLSPANIEASLAALDPVRAACFYSLYLMLVNAVYSEDYEPDPGWADLIVPTEFGSALLRDDSGGVSGLTEPARKLGLFLTFYHHSVLIDIEQTGLEPIRKLLDKELQEGRVRLAYRFGRILYDKFNNGDYPDVIDHLNAGEVHHLLENTPRGISQLGTLVCGPLGILDSAERRLLPPSLRICLWHCSDPGCQAPHDVQLERSDLSFLRLKKHFERLLVRMGQPSRWNLVFRKILMGYGPLEQPAPRRYYNLLKFWRNVWLRLNCELCSSWRVPAENMLRKFVA